MTVLLKLLHFTEEENNELAIIFCSFVEIIAIPLSTLWHDISMSFKCSALETTSE
jgi:hypothetical protein